MCALAVVIGAAALGLAHSPMAFGAAPTVVMCFNGTTFTAPAYLQAYYVSRGATIGQCGSPN